MDSGTVFYARQDHAYILNFVGDLRYTLTHSLATILDRLFQKGDFDNVLIDLTGAESVDRTILGLLSKIANFMRNRFGRKASIVSTNPDINQIPDSVGFFGVFSICSDLGVAAEAAHQLPVAGTILEAHDILSQLNERTVPCSRTWWKP